MVKVKRTNPFSTIGSPVGRVDGEGKVTSRSKYTADVQLPGTLWGAVHRSSFSHARIVRVDTSRARALSGVHAVLAGEDLAGRLFGRAVADIPVLAYDRVRLIGEPVAAVAAEGLDTAEEACRLIEVEYEELPAVFDPFEAMQADAPLLHPRFREYRHGYRLGDFTVGDKLDLPDIRNLCSYEEKSKGDIERGFREADLVLEHEYTTPIQHQGYLEPHTCLVSVEPNGTIRIWASNKAPFTLKDLLVLDLGLPSEKVVIEPIFVGGDFGGKGSPMLIPLTYFLSKATGRPVRIVMDGVSEFMAGNPRHAAWITIRTGLKHNGTIVARHVKMVMDSGAYAGYKPIPYARLWGLHVAAGVYRVPHIKAECMIVYTNHVPAGHMRSPGGAQAAFACEVDIDRLAEAVGMDPLEFRLKNGVNEGEPAPLGDSWTSIRLKECLQSVKTASGWGRRKPPNVGRGVAICQDVAGWGGSTSVVEVHRDGSATLKTGVNDQGSGPFTILVQIVGNELQLPLDRVKLVVAGTDSGIWDRGSSGMSVTHVAGQATLRAATEVRNKLAAVAGECLGCPEGQIELVKGVFRNRERRKATIPFVDVAARACRDGESVSGTCRFEAWKLPTGTSFVAQVAEVEVDPDTGQVKVCRVVAASDIGTVLNPIGVTGQIEGAMVMGLGFATTEEVRLADGQVETLGLHDYKLPTIRDVPRLQNLLITDGEGPGPYGAKAAGELGNLPITAAIANAVYDAIGIRVDSLPITAEKVYQALKAASRK